MTRDWRETDFDNKKKKKKQRKKERKKEKAYTTSVSLRDTKDHSTAAHQYSTKCVPVE